MFGKEREIRELIMDFLLPQPGTVNKSYLLTFYWAKLVKLAQPNCKQTEKYRETN